MEKAGEVKLITSFTAFLEILFRTGPKQIHLLDVASIRRAFRNNAAKLVEGRSSQRVVQGCCPRTYRCDGVDGVQDCEEKHVVGSLVVIA